MKGLAWRLEGVGGGCAWEQRVLPQGEVTASGDSQPFGQHRACAGMLNQARGAGLAGAG